MEQLTNRQKLQHCLTIMLGVIDEDDDEIIDSTLEALRKTLK